MFYHADYYRIIVIAYDYECSQHHASFHVYIYVWGVSVVILEFVRQMVLLLANVLCMFYHTDYYRIIVNEYDYECRAVHNSEHHA